MKHEQGLTSRRVKWIGVSHHDMNALAVLVYCMLYTDHVVHTGCASAEILCFQ